MPVTGNNSPCFSRGPYSRKLHGITGHLKRPTKIRDRVSRYAPPGKKYENGNCITDERAVFGPAKKAKKRGDFIPSWAGSVSLQYRSPIS
jgi:hypothetical protein